MAPRKPALSPTRICTYLDCPRRYYYVYIRKLPRYFEARAQFSFGTALHRALQGYHEAGGPAAENAEALVARLEQSWIRAGYESAAEEQSRFELGREILAAYHQAGGHQEGVTRFTEKVIRVDRGEYVLTGRIDRIDELPDGTLEVIDYKSGLRLPSPEEVGDDLPIAIYQFLCARALGCTRVKGSLYHLRSGQKVSILRTADELVPIAAGVDALYACIRDDDQFAPVRDERCFGCDYYTRCWDPCQGPPTPHPERAF